MRVHVAGGTNAGTRPPYEGQPEPWPCRCVVRDLPPMAANELRLNPGYLAACPDCGAKRP